jgi:hypothetical protein
MPEEKDYVDFDHEFAQQVPHLVGKYKDVVKKYYEETFQHKQKEIGERLHSIAQSIKEECGLTDDEIRNALEEAIKCF